MAIDQSYKVNPGSCKVIACLPSVVSMAVPFECLGIDGESNDIVYTEIMYLKPSGKFEEFYLRWGQTYSPKKLKV